MTEKHCLLFHLHDVAKNIHVNIAFNTPIGFGTFHIWMSVENVACTAPSLVCLWVPQEHRINRCYGNIVWEIQTIEPFLKKQGGEK